MLKSCHRQDYKGTVGLGGPDVEDERTEGEGGEEGEPGPPEPEEHQHLPHQTGAACLADWEILFRIVARLSLLTSRSDIDFVSLKPRI